MNKMENLFKSLSRNTVKKENVVDMVIKLLLLLLLLSSLLLLLLQSFASKNEHYVLSMKQ